MNFEVSGHQYKKGYYLADGIYPQWSPFVKTISNPQGEKRARFAQAQESARKDVERAFGVLQSYWAIVRHPARTWSSKKMWEVMTAYVIMHNMIVEDERPEDIGFQGFQYQGTNVVPERIPATFAQFTSFIPRCEITRLIFSFRMIWLGTCEHILATRRCVNSV